LESVVSWWTSPERRAERRARLESLDVLDFRYEETLEDGQRITETGWTTRRGLQVSLRTVSPIRPGGTVERTPDGRALLRTQTFKSCRQPDAREDLSGSEVVLEFSELPENRTRILVTATLHKEGAPWWGRRLTPNDHRRHMRMHLMDTIAKCEHDLGTRRSAKRWFAVY
jgi:hypothetical protein